MKNIVNENKIIYNKHIIYYILFIIFVYAEIIEIVLLLCIFLKNHVLFVLSKDAIFYGDTDVRSL